MPLISRWMIRLSLVYLLLGLTAGSLMLINKAWMVHPLLWAALPAHIEWMIFGWIIQFTLGTAYWILPRFLDSKSRGNEPMAWTMLLSLNLGIWFIIADGFSLIPYAGLSGRVLETLGVVLFALLHWKRIVTYGDHEH
ncbi:hypothetical protein [Gracilimonas mengyeensis]|uniref:Cytochrome C and Quinol oxidase polypeptide I n=1 Tax=Gracilimonas mengyeensis TaxID=1302730 RepID=A0A521C5G9_9BACT|nr:hypothetical protein [Gracilimonas mengyeensis]SMO54664.1 hypothetical protein SAMN06265219_104182 [Gracilimonas mengyeensis]